MTLLASLDTDLSPEFKKAVASIPYAAAGGPAVQAPLLGAGRRRVRRAFDDRPGDRPDHLPVPRTQREEGRPHRLLPPGQQGRAVGERTPPERQALALEQGSRIHPQYPREFEHAFSVAWHKVPWSYGSWANFSAEARKDAYPLLITPQGRLFLAGDHVTRMNAWMQGAFQSARQVAAIHARVGQERVERSSPPG